jgi:di/tricarboxylate transporter
VYSKPKALLSVCVLIGMVCLAFFGLPMVYASLIAAVIVVVFRCVSPYEISKCIRWSLLILIGSTYSFAIALENTGIANSIASWLLPIMQVNKYLLIAGTFVIVAATTEMITNTAAVLIIFPIVSQIAAMAGFDDMNAHKAIAVTTALAGSCAFITPIGYQTNTIVYGPGGYRFLDYTRVGAPMTLLLLILCTILVPYFWPF